MRLNLTFMSCVLGVQTFWLRKLTLFSLGWNKKWWKHSRMLTLHLYKAMIVFINNTCTTADAKSTPAYSLDLHILGIKMQLVVLIVYFISNILIHKASLKNRRFYTITQFTLNTWYNQSHSLNYWRCGYVWLSIIL